MSTGLWAVLGLAGLAAAAITFRRARLHLATAGAVAAMIFAIGAAHVRISYFSVPADHIVTYTGGSPILATLRGCVVTFPQVYQDPVQPEEGYSRGPRTTFIARAETIAVGPSGRREWKSATGLVRVTVGQGDRRLAAGQRLELVGRLGRFRPPNNPGEFDFAARARNHGTLVRMSVPGVDGVTLLPGRLPWYARLVWRIRAAGRQHLLACGDDRSGHLLNALVTGERHPALRSLNRTMVRIGIAHFLSISGLHLGVFLGFVYFLCRLLALSPRRAAIVVLVILGAYILLAEPRAPLLRSAIMATALCIAIISQRRYTALNALAAAAICLLAVDPLQLFAPGFQLSFAVVAGLLLLHRPMRNFLFGRWLHRRGLMVFRGPERLRRWLYYRAANFCMDLASLFLTASVVSAPLVAYHFGRFCPYAPISSLVLFPIVLAILIPGYVSMALAWPMPNLSHAIGRLAASAADTMTEAVGWIGDIPGAGFELRPVGALWLVMCYGAILLVVAWRRLRRGSLWAVGAMLLVAIATAYTQRDAAAPPAAELHLLGVGEGQCAILRTPAGRTYILDAGTRSGIDAYQQVMKPFFRARRLPAPRTAIISHANTDHFNALLGMLRDRGLDKAYLNDYFGEDLAGRDAQEADAELLGLLAERKAAVIRIRSPATIDLDDRTKVEVLWPGPEKRNDLNANDTSLVLRITCDGRSVLLTGDIGQVPQSALIGRGSALRADVLIMPHHGGWERTLPAFVGAVGAKVVLVSGHGHAGQSQPADSPGAVFYDTLTLKYEYYTTGRNGWICLRFGAGGTRVTTMR
ncbi:MAG: ComEC/Rec2 family competence protein [Phycisphaerae bacterium]|nr:ComEC/Rec2 family competence protein [Phycisphaerae bacterium]